MVRKIDRPACFAHLPVALECFAFCDESGPMLYLGVEVVGSIAAIHSDVVRWSHNCAKKIGADWQAWKERYVSEYGIKKIVATFEDATDKKWPKFIKMFGFPEPKAVLFSVMEV